LGVHKKFWILLKNAPLCSIFGYGPEAAHLSSVVVMSLEANLGLKVSIVIDGVLLYFSFFTIRTLSTQAAGQCLLLLLKLILILIQIGP